MARAGSARATMVLTAGVIDSFGLALGQTTFTLLAVDRGGLGTAALYNAAALLGMMLSAPVTAALTRRWDGRRLLAVVGAVELLLRVGTLCGVQTGTPTTVIAVGVVTMNVAAWTGYAGMRAEMAATGSAVENLTRYAVAIAAIESLGAAVAGLVPLTGPHGVRGHVVVVVTVLYAASLAPQFVCARWAQVPAGGVPAGVHRGTGRAASSRVRAALPAHGGHRATAGVGDRGLPAVLGLGMLVMLVGSGPATLGVALTAELYGSHAVVLSAVAFTAGCLSAPALLRALDRSRVRPAVGWPVLGALMVVGWVGAPRSIALLVLAQLAAGAATTAFAGTMDAVVASRSGPGRLTAALAWAGAARAGGTAVAVRMVPVWGPAAAVGMLGGVATAVFAVAAMVGVVRSARDVGQAVGATAMRELTTVNDSRSAR